ncbi:uncharacterized protein UTRI_01749_B [Ustilago trichophora]|uniref:Uncharacterized protein n=1 Tax=Ustilago trichophora TaxID=86804 RepID=A0A5C3E3S8_9BASI|nr:uncharacterized protein UTRI_01749_B [Ustilago trichophora]
MCAPTTTTTKIGSLTILNDDDNQLLRILLRSVPSAQYRPDLNPDFEVMEDELLLLPKPPPHRGNVDVSAAKAVGVEVKTESEVGKSVPGVLARLGALFSRLAAVKVEDKAALPSTKTVDPTLCRDMIVNTTGPEHTRMQSDRTASEKDEDDEMEVEYMILAEKCVAIPTMSNSTAKRRRKRSTRRGKTSQDPDSPSRKRRSKSNTPCPPSTPPSIERRRQQLTGLNPAKGPSPRKKKKSVPGFM